MRKQKTMKTFFSEVLYRLFSCTTWSNLEPFKKKKYTSKTKSMHFLKNTGTITDSIGPMPYQSETTSHRDQDAFGAKGPRTCTLLRFCPVFLAVWWLSTNEESSFIVSRGSVVGRSGHLASSRICTA